MAKHVLILKPGVLHVYPPPQPRISFDNWHIRPPFTANYQASVNPHKKVPHFMFAKHDMNGIMPF